MAENILNTRIQLKYDTYANWDEKNPVLRWHFFPNRVANK